MKTCRVCEQEKPIDSFTKDKRRLDGHIAVCVACYNARRRGKHKTNPERSRRFRKADPARRARISQAWRDRNPIREKASAAVRNAVRDGGLIKPAACETCGRTGQTHGHHEDYSKPLDVSWLCPVCHKARHRTEQP